MIEGRTRCCIQPCNRTTKEKHQEWICQKHWQLIPRRKRAAYSRTKRRMNRKPTEENYAAMSRIWERMKHLAQFPHFLP